MYHAKKPIIRSRELVRARSGRDGCEETCRGEVIDPITAMHAMACVQIKCRIRSITLSLVFAKLSRGT